MVQPWVSLITLLPISGGEVSEGGEGSGVAGRGRWVGHGAPGISDHRGAVIEAHLYAGMILIN